MNTQDSSVKHLVKATASAQQYNIYGLTDVSPNIPITDNTQIVR